MMKRNLLMHCVVAMLVAIVSVTASAQGSTFRISQVFSNHDGNLQFIELTETAGLNDQHRLAGLTLTSTHNGIVKQFTFPRDLPTNQTAHISIVVAASTYAMLPVTAIDPNYWSGYCCHVPDFSSLPLRFIATDGGTLDFAGVDRMTYSSLPTDGVTALYRDGGVRQATVPSNGRCYAPVICEPRYTIAQSHLFAIEYYNAVRDHYFVTASAPDIDALDAGRLPGWQRTGEGFYVGAGRNTYPELDQPVCRFYLPPGSGDSHFFSASTDECDEVRARFPAFVLESTAAFYAALPEPATGACHPGFVIGGLPLPLYRLWNQRADSNHRYTTNAMIRDEMVRRGYLSEGYGLLGVAMCVPYGPYQ